MEKQGRGLAPADRFELPQLEARPIPEKLQQYLRDIQLEVLPKSPEGRAVRYALKNWTALTRYADDDYLEIGRVEMWRGGLGWAYLFPAFRFAVPH